MVVGLINLDSLNLNANSKINLSGSLNDYSDQSIFSNGNLKNLKSEATNAKVQKDEANGFDPKDIFDIDKFFVPMLKSAIGPAMTYLISYSAFNKCDKDGNKVLTSDEYSELTANYNFNLSGSDNTDNNGKTGNNFLKKMLDLLSSATGCSLMDIGGVEEIKDAFVNTLKMMIGIDKNNNGIIEKNEFSDLLDEKSTEPIPEDIKDSMFSSLSLSQKNGQGGLDLGSFTKFAFESKLAWAPNKKINTDIVLSDFGRNPENNTFGKKKEALMFA